MVSVETECTRYVRTYVCIYRQIWSFIKLFISVFIWSFCGKTFSSYKLFQIFELLLHFYILNSLFITQLSSYQSNRNTYNNDYKVTCIWEYDKRSVNGANFVYYGMFLKGLDGPREKALVAYAKQVGRKEEKWLKWSENMSVPLYILCFLSLMSCIALYWNKEW